MFAETFAGSRGPLTKGLTADIFSQRKVAFDATTWQILLFLLLLFLAHELYAWGKKPLLADNQKANTFPFQCALLFFWFYWYVNQSLVLPVTLDFAASMGQSATMSGFFVSSPLATSIAGLQVGKMIIGENAWDQASARRLIIWAPLVSVMLTAIEAAVSNSVVHFDLPAKRASFWVILALSNLAAFIVALPYVPLMVMWAKFTPKREMTFWMIMAQCSRQSGFLVGPAVFALLSQLVGRGKPIAPASALAWVLVAQVIIGWLQLA